MYLFKAQPKDIYTIYKMLNMKYAKQQQAARLLQQKCLQRKEMKHSNNNAYMALRRKDDEGCS
jgi:hypothetical protein